MEKDMTEKRTDVMQLVIFRKDLKMTKTDMLTQGNTALIELLKSKMKRDKQFLGKHVRYIIEVESETPMDILLSENVHRQYLYVENENELLHLYNRLKVLEDVPAILLETKALRGFKGTLTKSCVAVGPARVEDIEKIVGRLQPI